VGAIDLYDSDVVSPSNINRQIIATTSTVGRYKVDVAQERILDINPGCRVRGFKMFYVVANAGEVDLSQYDYVLDCIDTVSAKMELVRRCTRLGVPIICSMGAANKLDASAFSVADISQTDVDPLARIMRKRLRKEGIEHFKCVFSKEQPRKPLAASGNAQAGKRPVPASNAWVPAAAGLVLGGEVVLDLVSTIKTVTP
ncbi:MAG: tRNA threonylcarbamoyladenosine dehydratase, partial [Muribaculaceae bacterium]|nr:tRNA threonylcarbamoyladenosine dehydratase [Muribaculaceae bacterium]